MISVALCTYNGEQYIKDQLESILNQTMPVDEIVVCDDGSTDNTLLILEKIKKETSTKFHIYCNEQNLGVSANFQKAIDLCHGDIVFLSDQDDVWHSDKVKQTVDYFSQHPYIQVVFTDANLISNDGSKKGENLWDYTFNNFYRKQFDHHLGFEALITNNQVTGATMALRKTFTQRKRFGDLCTTNMLHDHVIALLAIMDNSLGYIDKPLINYRIHKNQQRGIFFAIKSVPSKNFLTALQTHSDAMHVIKSTYYINRAKFLTFRIELKRKATAPFLILQHRNDYSSFYGELYAKMMMFDTRICIGHTVKRLIKKET